MHTLNRAIQSLRIALLRERLQELCRKFFVVLERAIVQCQRFADAVHRLQHRFCEAMDDLLGPVLLQLLQRRDIQKLENLASLVVLQENLFQFRVTRYASASEFRFFW